MASNNFEPFTILNRVAAMITPITYTSINSCQPLALNADKLAKLKPCSLTDIKACIQYGLELKTTPISLKHLQKIDASITQTQTIKTSPEEYQRLTFAQKVIRGFWGLMQNGQGNQKQSIQKSNRQSFINTTLVRSLNRLMSLETSELSAVCEAKGSLVMGKAVSEDTDVQELESELKKLQATKAPAQKIAETTSKLKDAKQEAYEFGQFLYKNRLTKLKKAQEKQKPEDEEQKLTSRALNTATLGAGNCSDFAELAFYLITHGVFGDLPANTPIYQVELAHCDHNVVLIGDLKQNPILIDSWIMQPMALRFNETQYAKKVDLNKDNLEMELTIINEFKASDKIKPAFPKGAIHKHTLAIKFLIQKGEINYPSHKEITEDLEMHERTKLIVDRQLMTDKLVQYI
tara:strand:- start:2644 stop:3855 length:1212 start_codon:yes stop_codon:yes gene_type:complete